MKPTLFWTLKRHPWAGGYVLMRVTTAKATRYYGTDENEISTHCRTSETYGRYDTAEKATAVIDEIRKAHAEFEPAIKAAQRTLHGLEHRQREACEQMARGTTWAEIKALFPAAPVVKAVK